MDQELLRNKLNDVIASGLVAKAISKYTNITTDVLLKICEALDCKVEDIIETIKE